MQFVRDSIAVCTRYHLSRKRGIWTVRYGTSEIEGALLTGSSSKTTQNFKTSDPNTVDIACERRIRSRRTGNRRSGDRRARSRRQGRERRTKQEQQRAAAKEQRRVAVEELRRSFLAQQTDLSQAFSFCDRHNIERDCDRRQKEQRQRERRQADRRKADRRLVDFVYADQSDQALC